MKVDKTKWEYKKLGDICQIQTGKLDANAKVENGQYPFFTCDYKPYRIDKYAFDTEAILISGNGSLVGHVNYYNGKFNAYQRTYVLTQFKLFYIPYLIIYLKRNLRPYIIQNKKGGCIPYITLPILKNFKILYPSLYEQRDIAAELDAVQKMIEGYKAQLADLDTLGQSIFLDMFGDVVNNERKWNFVKFGSLTSSINYGTSAPAVDGGKYKYLRMGNITDNGHLDFQDIKYIDIPDNEIAKYIVHKGDILFNRTNSREKVGKTACFMEEEEMIIAGYIIRIRLNEEKSLPLYIAQAFNTPEMKSYLRRLARGSVGQANINSKELSDIKISVPPLPLQQQFAERVEAIERQKELLQAQLAEAQTLMAERMQYYFD